MKRYGNDQIKIFSTPGLKKDICQQRYQKSCKIASVMKLQSLNESTKLVSIIAKRPGSIVGRHLLNAVAAKMLRVAAEAVEGEPAGRTTGRYNLQGNGLFPTVVTDSAIPLPEYGRRTEEAHIRVNQIQQAVENPKRLGVGQVPCCR